MQGLLQGKTDILAKLDGYPHCRGRQIGLSCHSVANCDPFLMQWCVSWLLLNALGTSGMDEWILRIVWGVAEFAAVQWDGKSRGCWRQVTARCIS